MYIVYTCKYMTLPRKILLSFLLFWSWWKGKLTRQGIFPCSVTVAFKENNEAGIKRQAEGGNSPVYKLVNVVSQGVMAELGNSPVYKLCHVVSHGGKGR